MFRWESFVRPESVNVSISRGSNTFSASPPTIPRDDLAVEEFTVPRNATGVPPHIHDGHDEYFYILDGQLTLWAGEAEVAAEAGAVVAAPRGVPHGYPNDTEQPATALCLYTPAGYENYFREVHAAIARGEDMSEDKLAEFRAKYATRPYPG